MKRIAALASALVSLVVAVNGVHATETTDPKPDPDACALISAGDLEPLLFSGAGGVLDSQSNHPAPGLSVCRWEARPRDHAVDAVPRKVILSFYHLADAQTARAQLARQPNRDARASLAISGEGDDGVVRPGPAIVVARHGDDVTVLDALGAELDKPDQVEVRYLLDALALKASGATVKPPPWGRPATITRWTPTSSAGDWTPPPHPAPRGAVLLEPLLHVGYVLAQMRFALMFPLMPTAALLIIFGGKAFRRSATSQTDRASTSPRTGRRWPAWLGGALIAVAVSNSLFGTALAYTLVDRFGVAGAATVTGAFATSTRYNRQNVVGYRVLIRTASGEAAESQFRTDDFNVLPSADSVSYPGPGDVFTIRYLPHFPRDIVIRADDSSPWARKLACRRLQAWSSEAQRRSAFDPADANLRAEAERARSAQRAASCTE